MSSRNVPVGRGPVPATLSRSMCPMRLRAATRDYRILVTRDLVRRGAVVGALTLAQRVLAPVVAWTLFGRDFPAKLAVTAALTGVFAAHTLVQRSFVALAEAALFDRVGTAILHGDVLRATLLPDEDARAELLQAIYQTAQTLGQTVPNVMADALACVALAVMIVAVEPRRLVVVAAMLTFAAAGTLLFSRRSVERAVTRAWAVQTRVYEAFVNVIDGRLEIVASGLRPAVLRDLRAKTSAWGTAGVHVATAAALSGRLPMLVIAVLVAVALVVSPAARHSAGGTLAEATLFASVTPAFAGVAQGMHALARAERWARVVARVLGARGCTAPPSGLTRHAPTLPASVTFEGVSFGYDGAPGSRDALQDVCFSWSGHGALALAGSNGSGKSTCLRLLLALARHRTGTVRIGGVPLDEVDADAWRSRLAFLPQRPYLPPRANVRDAIQWLAPEADDARILCALDRVGLAPSLRRVASNPLDVRADSLSVGERQRVALARLLCRDAELVVLDEPDANLDRAGIALVAGVLRELARTRMVVFAAHTPELLDIAERVVTLDGGRVVAAAPPVCAQ